ncbi:MAG: hypothetical protein Q9219_003890 [cf. Caloplaca sp. 3 TL-2023]
MPSCTDEFHQEIRDQKDPSDPHPPRAPPSAPPVIHRSESIQNASSVGQSPSAPALGTSPHHHRFNSVLSIHSPSVTAPPTPTQQRPTSSPSALSTNTPSFPTTRTSYFSHQPGSSGIEAHSPANKRAPASRSSYGIATANGPPPALITQRSYHGESWRNPLQSHSNPPIQNSRPKESAPATLQRRNTLNSRTVGGSKLDPMNGMSGSHGIMPANGDDDDTLRVLGGAQKPDRILPSHANGLDIVDGPEEDQSYSLHEDLFLDIARADSEAGNILNSTAGTTTRDSQVGPPTSRPVRNPRPASSGREYGGDRSGHQTAQWSRSGLLNTPTTGQYSALRDRGYAASAHPLDHGKRRYLRSEVSSKASFTTPRARNGSNRETSPEHPGPWDRRQSVTDSASVIPSRTGKNTARSYISSSHYDSSPITNISPHIDPTRNHQSSRLDGTESTISTTAPSTVWDELDDLKYRIRKLELTGKMPASSGAAINAATHNDRPRTSTTTMTTASISPKHGRANVTSPEASTVKDMDTSNLHPLLHSALAKAKSWIDPNAYKALESTVSDALTLAAMTNNLNSSGGDVTITGKSQIVDRQLRRKADSMCRSLTELCIALSEEKSSKEAPTAASRPGSKAGGNNIPSEVRTPENPYQLRASSQEPERSSSRIMSRLEARRTSLLAANAATPPSNDGADSPIIHNPNASTPVHPPARPERTSSVLLHRRRTVNGNDDINSPTNNVNSRPDQRPSPISRISREYTSQHPLPTTRSQQGRSPSVRSSLPSSASAQRSYFPSTPSNNNNSIAQQPAGRRYLSSSTTPTTTAERQTSSSAESNTQRLAEARQQRIASLGQFTSGRRLRLVEGEDEGRS